MFCCSVWLGFFQLVIVRTFLAATLACIGALGQHYPAPVHVPGQICNSAAAKFSCNTVRSAKNVAVGGSQHESKRRDCVRQFAANIAHRSGSTDNCSSKGWQAKQHGRREGEICMPKQCWPTRQDKKITPFQPSLTLGAARLQGLLGRKEERADCSPAGLGPTPRDNCIIVHTQHWCR